jgi:PAS domain S-box-containing protein
LDESKQTSEDVLKLEFLKLELKASQDMVRQLNNVFECSYDGIYITDGQANTLKVNKAYENITGLKKEEMIGRNMIELVREGKISQSATIIVLNSKKSCTIEQEFRIGKKALVSSSPVFNEDGDIIMVITNVRDVTELYELKEELEKNKELNKKYFSEIEVIRNQLLNEIDIIAEDEKMLNVLGIAGRVAQVDTTVLILGETGVGKEQVAKYIHKISKRSDSSFIKINCGAIPENLIESELFGYEKGAFTGANKDGKIGLFELADGGTIFLDEIGELPLNMQVKLLRVLQEGEIKRIGGVKTIKVDVRILAATNRDLKELIKQNLFRKDLYYRLNIVPIIIPPLRERKKDIEPLAKHFLATLNKKYNFNKSITSAAMNCFMDYEWKGNVRELKNIIERIVIMSRGDKILRSDLPINNYSQRNKIGININDDSIKLKDAVENLEARLIENAFKKHGNVRAAAKELGIDASTFVRKRKKYESKKSLAD